MAARAAACNAGLRLGLRHRSGNLRLCGIAGLHHRRVQLRHRLVRRGFGTACRRQVPGDDRSTVLQHLADFRQAPAGQQEIQHHQNHDHPQHLVAGERIVEIHLRHGPLRHGGGGAHQQQSGGGKKRASGEQNDQRDDQRVQRHGFRQREAEQHVAEHVVARGRVAADGGDERAEQITDTDAGTGDADGGEARTDIFGEKRLTEDPYLNPFLSESNDSQCICTASCRYRQVRMANT